MKLYTYFRSSSAWRVRIALAYKNVPFEPVFVHLLREGGEQHLEQFRELNPQGQLPVLAVEREGTERHLAQSIAIIEYLEETHPHPPLLPADPWERARARRLAEIVNSGMQPFQNLALRSLLRDAGCDGDAIAREMLVRGLSTLERLATESAGEFLVGDTLSVADVFLTPQLYATRRFSIDLTPYPTLLRVEARCAELDCFRKAAPDSQPDAEPVDSP